MRHYGNLARTRALNAEAHRREYAQHPGRVKARVEKWRKKNPELKVWQNMMARCYDTSHENYMNYGDRGIKVCPRWRSFKNFLADMGRRPSPHLTLERKKNWLGYSPENCMWATDFAQRRNSRRNHLIVFNGRVQCLADWARELCLWPNTIYRRLRRGLPIEQVLQC
jgi:hypothetical protein